MVGKCAHGRVNDGRPRRQQPEQAVIRIGAFNFRIDSVDRRKQEKDTQRERQVAEQDSVASVCLVFQKQNKSRRIQKQDKSRAFILYNDVDCQAPPLSTGSIRKTRNSE